MPNQIKILMADDDSEDLELMEEAFKECRPGEVRLHKLNDGKMVLDYLDSLPDIELPCLIVLDYNMPGMKGSEVVSLLCQTSRYASLPKAILSTSSAVLHIEECMNNGATAYFVKPNHLAELKELAQNMLALCKAA